MLKLGRQQQATFDLIKSLNGEITVEQIAFTQKISRQRANETVQKLEKRGLVIRQKWIKIL